MKSKSLQTQVFVFSDENELKNFHLKKSIDPQYRCNICNKKYTTLSILKSHKIRHKDKDERPFDCTFCSYKGASKRDLLRHHEMHLGRSRPGYNCHYCKKAYNKEYLAEHIRSSHTKEILYKCGQCSFSCYRRSNLRQHLKIHEQNGQIICPICNATFKTDSNLKTHLRSHAGVKPFLCEQCDKSFVVKNRLLRHIQAAHSPKGFECDTCQKRFSNIHLLKRHALIHTGERPFKCCFCTYDSNTQGNLVKHVRKIHRLYYFTYKDLLIKEGIVEDPCEGLSKEELQRLIDRGKKTVHSQLKTFHEKGLTKLSYQDLEKVETLKKKLKEDFIKRNSGKKARSKRLKEQKLKGRSELEPRKNSESNKLPKEVFNNSRKRDNRISVSSKDLSLSHLDDVIHSENDMTSVSDGVKSNTPTIHVLWNLNYPLSHDSKTLAINAKRKSNVKRSKVKLKSTCAVKRKSLKAKSHPSHDNETLLCRNSSSLNASHLLEDNELTFNDKPLMQINETENFSPSDCNSDLASPLDNLRNDLVTFEEIESPNTVVVTSDENSYIDKVYKNVDLCNQFLHINEEEPHLICTFETVSSPQEESRNVPKVTMNSNSSYTTEGNLPQDNHDSISDGELDNYKVADEDFSDNSNEIPTEIKELIDAANSMSGDKETEITLIDNDEASNLMITIHSFSDFNGMKSEVDIPKQEMEEIILLQESERGKTLPPLFFVNEISSVQSSKEIVIKNSASNLELDNDDMVVTSIAEIEENESEVVLVIS